MSDQAPVQLRSLANDCEERARLTSNQEAERIYRTIARLARATALAPDLASDERRACLVELRKGLEFARWLVGEKSAERLPKHETQPTHSVAPDALNARQLAELFGLNERTVRNQIDYGNRCGWPGHFRVGCHLYALPSAIAHRNGLRSDGIG